MAGWLALSIAGVVVCGLAVALLVRHNQLKMAYALCDEARRQARLDITARHNLVPSFVHVAGELLPELMATSALEKAFVAAKNARTACEVADIEAHLSDEILALLNRVEHAALPEDMAAAPRLLYLQMENLEERLSAALRYFNTSVDQYMRMRSRPLSWLVRRSFAPLEPVPWKDFELPDHSDTAVDGTGPASAASAGAASSPDPLWEPTPQPPQTAQNPQKAQAPQTPQPHQTAQPPQTPQTARSEGTS